MAFTANHNVTGSTGTTVELIAPGANTSGIRSILLSNIHATAVATVTLFIQNNPIGVASSTYKIINVVSIPANVSLLIDDAALMSFDGNIYGLYITVGATDTVDVIINR